MGHKTALALAFVLGGCAGQQDATPSEGAVVNCELDPRVDTYTSNMSKGSASDTVQVTLVSSDPAPPSKGNNTWRVRVADASGTPISNAPIDVQLFMPDHDHGTSVVPVITPGEDGIYDLVPMNLFMPGVWRITIGNVTGNVTGSSPQDAVEFFFCIAG